MLRSDLCDYSDAIYLLAALANENDKPEKDVPFKNNKPLGRGYKKLTPQW